METVLQAQWDNPLFRETAALILGVLFASGVVLFPFRTRNANFLKAWHSLSSWLIGAPVFFVLIGSGHPWPIVGFVAAAIFAAKEFYQMAGMYHRNTFVWTTYFTYIAMGYCILHGHRELFNFLPMIFLGIVCILPLVHNNAKNMIQYIALSLLATNLIGWAFLHLGWVAREPNGAYFAIYLVLLTEICDNTALAVSKLFGKRKILENLAANRTLEGIVVCIIVTMAVAYGMRHLLPDRQVKYWLVSGVVTVLAGGIGGVVLSMIRRDLGIRESGAFIIGRGGVLDRIERLIFTAPTYYFVMQFIEELKLFDNLPY